MNEEFSIKAQEKRIKSGRRLFIIAAVMIIVIANIGLPQSFYENTPFTEDYLMIAAFIAIAIAVYDVFGAQRKLKNPEFHIKAQQAEHARLLQAQNEKLERELAQQQAQPEAKRPETVGHVTSFERGTDVQELPEHIKRMGE